MTVLGIALAGGIAMASSACSGRSDDGDAGPTTPPATVPGAPSVEPASPAPIPAGFRTVIGTSYQFGLPTELDFASGDPVVTSDGGIETQWTHAVAPSGPYCVVIATEQARFEGAFPESAIARFDAKTQPGQKTLRNAVMKPAPPGAVSGVDQESTFTATQNDGTALPSHLYQRTFLTPNRSLAALTAAGPQESADTCRLKDIVATFSATGREFSGATSARSPAATPSAGSTGGI
jgi:hypothetical protein